MIVISDSSPLNYLILSSLPGDDKGAMNKIQQMQGPLKINPETAKLLTNQAGARGLSVEDYLKSLLGVTPESMASNLEEFLAAMESLTDDVEPPRCDFSHEDICFPEGVITYLASLENPPYSAILP